MYNFTKRAAGTGPTLEVIADRIISEGNGGGQVLDGNGRMPNLDDKEFNLVRLLQNPLHSPFLSSSETVLEVKIDHSACVGLFKRLRGWKPPFLSKLRPSRPA